MKNRIKTWEIILAGCAFTALSIYVMIPAHTPAHTSHLSQNLHLKVPLAPKAPSGSDPVTINLKELETLKELKELDKIKKELQKAEKELKKASIKLETVTIPELKGLPEILISSH